MLRILPFLCFFLLGLIGCSRYEDDVLPTIEGGTTILNNDTYTAYKNQTLRLNVLDNDTVQTDGMLLFGRADHGVISSDSAGFLYRPDLNYLGTDQFYYKYCSESVCDSALVMVTVSEPTGCLIKANHDLATTTVGQAVTVAVLNNDVVCGPVIISNYSAPINGTVTLLPSNELRYTPNTGFAGKDSLSYEIESPDKRRSLASLTITVNSVCNLVANTDVVATVMNDTVAIYPLRNDNTCNIPVKLSVTGNPASGTVQVINNSYIVYQPANNYVGTDQFVYQICQGSKCTTGIVNVTVNAPTVNCITGFAARNDSIPLLPGTPATNFYFNVLANDTYCLNQFISLSIIQPFANYGTVMPVMHNGSMHINYVKTNPPGTAYTDIIRYEIRMNVNGQVQSRTAWVQVIFR